MIIIYTDCWVSLSDSHSSESYTDSYIGWSENAFNVITTDVVRAVDNFLEQGGDIIVCV